jgi:hypothetical protein
MGPLYFLIPGELTSGPTVISITSGSISLCSSAIKNYVPPVVTHAQDDNRGQEKITEDGRLKKCRSLLFRI